VIPFCNRFSKQEHAAEIYENQPIGTYVKHLEARSTSSLFFEIIEGNKDDMFFINPSTGVIITKRQLDYELNKFYNLTVEATNMVSRGVIMYFLTFLVIILLSVYKCLFYNLEHCFYKI
jgi:Cadherin domain.